MVSASLRPSSAAVPVSKPYIAAIMIRVFEIDCLYVIVYVAVSSIRGGLGQEDRNARKKTVL